MTKETYKTIIKLKYINWGYIVSVSLPASVKHLSVFDEGRSPELNTDKCLTLAGRDTGSIQGFEICTIQNNIEL